MDLSSPTNQKILGCRANRGFFMYPFQKRGVTRDMAANNQTVAYRAKNPYHNKSKHMLS